MKIFSATLALLALTYTGTACADDSPAVEVIPLQVCPSGPCEGLDFASCNNRCDCAICSDEGSSGSGKGGSKGNYDYDYDYSDYDYSSGSFCPDGGTNRSKSSKGSKGGGGKWQCVDTDDVRGGCPTCVINRSSGSKGSKGSGCCGGKGSF